MENPRYVMNYWKYTQKSFLAGKTKTSVEMDDSLHMFIFAMGFGRRGQKQRYLWVVQRLLPLRILEKNKKHEEAI